MRSVSYVQRVALEFSGSLFPHAICLGDVDNDTVSACALRETRSGSAAPLGVGRGQGSGEADRGVRRARRACAVGLARWPRENLRVAHVPGIALVAWSGVL